MDLLSVSPQQLTFYAPYDHVQRRILTLLNPTDKTVLFKINSNAFRHYGVMPTAGKVEPYDTTEIRISLRCFDFQEGQKYRHKFKIHSFTPDKRFNGETPSAIFQRLPREEICTKTLPVNLEAKPLSLSESGLNSLPCLKQLVIERNQQLRPLCPNCPEMLTKAEKPSGKGIKSVLITIVAFVAALLQHDEMKKILITLYQDQMSGSKDNFFCPDTDQDQMSGSKDNFFCPDTDQDQMNGSKDNFLGPDTDQDQMNGSKDHFLSPDTDQDQMNGSKDNFLGPETASISST